jgi:hypothetical protein
MVAQAGAGEGALDPAEERLHDRQAEGGIVQRIKSAIKSLFLPRGSHFRRVVFGPAAGAVMRIDFRHQTRLFLGIYEHELWPHFRALLRPGMRSFDIGGQNGYCALLIHRLTGGEVVSFECEAAHIPNLRETFARNSRKLSAVQAFVGYPAGSGVTALDEASRHYFVPDFIKMDVEGAEADVLRGARDTLASRPSLIIEVHGVEVERECLELLRPLGYRIRVVDRSRFFADPGRSLDRNRWLVCSLSGA